MPDRKTGPENRTAIAVSTSLTDANSTVNFSMDEEKGDAADLLIFSQPWPANILDYVKNMNLETIYRPRK